MCRACDLMRPRVYLLLSLAIHLSYAHLTALKKDDFDKGDDVDAESDSSLDKNDNFSQIDSNDGAKTTNSTDKEESSDNLGKIRVSIGDEIAIDTGGTSYTGTKTPLIIISPISIIDYARLYKKMESSKNESNVVMQEKLAMSDAVGYNSLRTQD